MKNKLKRCEGKLATLKDLDIEKNHKKKSHLITHLSGQELNPRLNEYKTIVLTNEPQH
jgi:hypothetical protein